MGGSMGGSADRRSPIVLHCPPRTPTPPVQLGLEVWPFRVPRVQLTASLTRRGRFQATTQQAQSALMGPSGWGAPQPLARFKTERSKFETDLEDYVNLVNRFKEAGNFKQTDEYLEKILALKDASGARARAVGRCSDGGARRSLLQHRARAPVVRARRRAARSELPVAGGR